MKHRNIGLMRRYKGILLGGAAIVLCVLSAWVSWQESPPETLQIEERKPSQKLVRSVNDVMVNLIKKDPASLHQLNQFIEASPFLKEQKRAFIERYYGQVSPLSARQYSQMFEIYLKSQEYTKTLQHQKDRETVDAE